MRLVLQTHIPPVPPGVDLSWAARIKNEHGLEALGPLGPPSWRNSAHTSTPSISTLALSL